MKYYVRQVRKFAKDEVIFYENSACDGMYIIDSGRVRVLKTVDINGEPVEMDLCILGPNAMFGEMGMIDDSPRSATVQALEPTVCTIITRHIFEDQLKQIQPWMVNLIRILVRRLRDTNQTLAKTLERQGNSPNTADLGPVLVETNSFDFLDNAEDDLSPAKDIIKQLFTDKDAVGRDEE